MKVWGLGVIFNVFAQETWTQICWQLHSRWPRSGINRTQPLTVTPNKVGPTVFPSVNKGSPYNPMQMLTMAFLPNPILQVEAIANICFPESTAFITAHLANSDVSQSFSPVTRAVDFHKPLNTVFFLFVLRPLPLLLCVLALSLSQRQALDSTATK